MEIRVLYGMKENTPDDTGSQAVDITKAISKDGFPKSYSMKLKGEGHFDFQVKEFSFKIIKSVFNEMLYAIRNGDTTSGDEYSDYTGMTNSTDGMLRALRHDYVLIYDAGTNEMLTRGFVDEIENWIDEEVKLKVFPDVVRMKDIHAGLEVTDAGNDDSYYDFKSDINGGNETVDVVHVRSIIQSLLNKCNALLQTENKRPSKDFTVNSNSCPDPDEANTISRWLGTVLHKRPNAGFSINLAKMFINAFDGSFVRKKSNGGAPSGYDWYYEEKDAGVIKRILIHKGQWLSIDQGQWMSWHFGFPNGIHLASLEFGFSYPNGLSFTTLSFGFSYPNGLSFTTLSFSWSIPNGLTFTTLSFSFSYPNGVFFSWCCSVGLRWTSIRFDLGRIIPALQWTSIRFDLGRIVPTLQWTTDQWDFGQIIPALEWTTDQWDLGNIVPTLEFGSVTWQIPNGSINVPANHVYIPCIGSEHMIFELAGGDMTFEEGYVKSIFPLIDNVYYISGSDGEEDDYGESINSLNDTYGDRFDNSGSCNNIPTSKIESFLENDENVDPVHHRVAFDWNESNSYVITKVKKKWNNMAGSDWLMSFETPFDFYQRMHYKNAKVNEILKDLAILTNRYFYVDQDNVVHLIPRGDPNYNPQKDIKRYYFINRKVKMKRDVEAEIKIKRYKQDSEGKVTNYGVVVREAEWDFIQSFYNDMLSGDVITNEFEIVRPTDFGLEQSYDYPQLMDLVYMDSDGDLTKLGVVIQKDEGTENSKSKYVAQFVKGGEA